MPVTLALGGGSSQIISSWLFCLKQTGKEKHKQWTMAQLWSYDTQRIRVILGTHAIEELDKHKEYIAHACVYMKDL